MPLPNSHIHCQAAPANAKIQAKSVSGQPHDQKNRQTSSRRRTPSR